VKHFAKDANQISKSKRFILIIIRLNNYPAQLFFVGLSGTSSRDCMLIACKPKQRQPKPTPTKLADHNEVALASFGNPSLTHGFLMISPEKQASKEASLFKLNRDKGNEIE